MQWKPVLWGKSHTITCKSPIWRIDKKHLLTSHGMLILIIYTLEAFGTREIKNVVV